MLRSLVHVAELTPEHLTQLHPGLYALDQLLTGGPAYQVGGSRACRWSCLGGSGLPTHLPQPWSAAQCSVIQRPLNWDP